MEDERAELAAASLVDGDEALSAAAGAAEREVAVDVEAGLTVAVEDQVGVQPFAGRDGLHVGQL